jgi:NAD(P)H dehydrogenase (quinone)
MNNATVLVIDGHPNGQSLGRALSDAYEAGARRAGALVERLDLRDLQFDPVLRAGFAKEQALEPDLLRARAMIERAGHVAWEFPMWWASPPALVRGFVDRLFLPKWAFAYERDSALPKRLLAGRSARVIVTMDSPWWWYALAYKRSIHGAFVNGTLSFCGFSPVQTRTIHKVRAMSAREIAAHIAAVGEDGSRDASALLARVKAAPVIAAIGDGPQ